MFLCDTTCFPFLLHSISPRTLEIHYFEKPGAFARFSALAIVRYHVSMYFGASVLATFPCILFFRFHCVILLKKKTIHASSHVFCGFIQN